MPKGLDIRRADRGDLHVMIEWAAREGWNSGLHDAACFHAADPEGFWIARQEGELAACISLVSYSPAFAFLGFYIAHPDFCRQGITLETLTGRLPRDDRRPRRGHRPTRELSKIRVHPGAPQYPLREYTAIGGRKA